MHPAHFHFGTPCSWQHDPRPGSTAASENSTAIKECPALSALLFKHHLNYNENTCLAPHIPTEPPCAPLPTKSLK